VTEAELDECEERIWTAWNNHDLGGDLTNWQEFIAMARHSVQLEKEHRILERRLEDFHLRLVKAAEELVGEVDRRDALIATLELKLKAMSYRLGAGSLN